MTALLIEHHRRNKRKEINEAITSTISEVENMIDEALHPQRSTPIIQSLCIELKQPYHLISSTMQTKIEFKLLCKYDKNEI